MEEIRIEGLTKKYKDTVAVNNLNLSINKGEILALLGVNGAGKTTTVKMLSCLTEPTSGDAYICGKSIRNDTAAVKTVIGVSPQETAVARELTVFENLDLICRIHGLEKAERESKISELATLFELYAVFSKKAGKLSGGWQRRLSIAMALVSNPRVLFLDEPSLGLDVISRCDLWEIIRELRGKTTIILTTHYMEEAEWLSDRIAIMKDGKLLACDTPLKIKNSVGCDTLEQAFIQIIKEG